MHETLKIKEIIATVQKLDRKEQLTLLEKLVSIIRNRQSASSTKLSELSGIGSKIWTKTNIDEYLDQERQNSYCD